VLTTGEETVAQLFERWDRDVLSTQVRPLARENYRSVAESTTSSRCWARRR